MNKDLGVCHCVVFINFRNRDLMKVKTKSKKTTGRSLYALHRV